MSKFTNIVKVFLCIVVTIVSTNSQVSQFPESLKFKHISIRDGLSQSSVYSICQDKYGFIWFGTESGINRYDGENIRVFSTERGDTSSLSDPFINVIYLDNDKNLWIGTENGVNRFDYNTEAFDRFFINKNKTLLDKANFITAILQDTNGKYWIGTAKGLYLFDPVLTAFRQIKLYEKKLEEASEVSVTAIFRDREGNIWVGTEIGLYKANRSEFSASLFALRDNEISGIIQDDSEIMWITSDGGLARFETKSNQIRIFNKSNSKGLVTDALSGLLIDQKNTFWITTDGEGLIIYDPVRNIFKNYSRSENNPAGLQNNYINTVFEDQSGAIWFGTHDVGVEVYERNKNFKRLFTDSTTGDDISSTRVFAIFQDYENDLWIGTYGGGLNLYNVASKKITHYTSSSSSKIRLSSNDITTIYASQASKSKIWIGTTDAGIIIIDKRSGRTEYIKAGDNTIPSNEIYSIRSDYEGMYWIATSEGLCRYNPSAKEFKTFKHSPEDSTSISGNFARYIFQDSDRNLWIGTWGAGLNKYNRETETFERYLTGIKDSQGELTYIMNIAEGPNGYLWLGTYGFGVIKFDKKTKDFQLINEKNGLPNSAVYATIVDNNGNLWLPTNNGLAKYDSQTGSVKNFYEMDGLLSNEFNDGAYCKLKDGRIILGSYSGLDIFDPDEIEDNEYIPPIVFTSYKKFNEEVKLEQSLNEIEKIELSYDDRLISFDFKVMNFIKSEKNRYAYKLVGLADEWIQLGNKNTVTFTSLDPGEYKFIIKGSNNDGIWNEEGRFINIYVEAPFYDTVWFKAVFIFLAVLIVFLFYKTNLRRIQKQKETLSNLVTERTSELAEANEILKSEIEERIRAEEEVSRYVEELQESKDLMERNAFDLVEINLKIEESEQKLLELNAQKDKFFSIISHDLKSPFIALLGYSEILIEEFKSLSQEELLEFIQSINKASKNVYNLLENLLEWSRIQTGRTEYYPEFFNVQKTAQNVVELMADSAAQKNIKLENRIDIKSTVYADENMVNTVLRNLVSNAIKFTREDGEIILSTVMKDDFLIVTVSDTGIGMSESDVEKLFRIDVHHTTIGTNKEKGTGVGLILCKELIEQNSGEIWVESIPDTGSKFNFSLPKKMLSVEETENQYK